MIRRIHRWGWTMLVCIAACQNDEMPSAAGAERATTAEPVLSAAGAPAAAIGVQSSTVPAAMPSAASGSAQPSMPGAANAPSAVAGGERSAMSGAAGSAMASVGSAGSSADSKPAEQPANNQSSAAGCELPTTYTRAARSIVELSWPETNVRTAGTGAFVAWMKASYTTGSDGTREVTLQPCGSIAPEMTLAELLGGLKSAAQVPLEAFDSPNMPTIRQPIVQLANRSLSFRTNTALGTMLPDPDADWPSPKLLMPLDHDGDGSPGITSLPLVGPEYAKAPTSISQLEFVDRLYLATRVEGQVSVTPVCSGTAIGTTEPLGFDSTVVGCHVEGRDDCTERELRFIQDGSPNFTVAKSGHWAEVEVPQDANCAEVRAALPPP